MGTQLPTSPHKGQRRGALMFSLVCAWITVVQLRKYKLCTVLSIWRTPQSVKYFCGRLFGSVASNLHLRLIFCKYEMLTMVRCHLSVILFTQFFQLAPRLLERRARYWPFRNINRERCYSPTRESTSRKGTVLTTSGTVPANIFVCLFFVRFLKTTEYDRVNTRSNVAAHPIYEYADFIFSMLMRCMPWTTRYCHGHEHIPWYWILQTWCFVLGVKSDNTMALVDMTVI